MDRGVLYYHRSTRVLGDRVWIADRAWDWYDRFVRRSLPVGRRFKWPRCRWEYRGAFVKGRCRHQGQKRGYCRRHIEERNAIIDSGVA